MSKIYRGVRISGSGMAEIKVVQLIRFKNRSNLVPSGAPLRHCILHSPTGMEWGYGGSGPADLALSILCDYFEEKPSPADIRTGNFSAFPFYQDFKWSYIASIPENESWEITEAEIDQWITVYDARRAIVKFAEAGRVEWRGEKIASGRQGSSK
jgi:hypothetical protein